MKAIGIKMVDLEPMTATEAAEKGYRVGTNTGDGYEVTYDNGYKSWSPKEIADNAYFRLSAESDGTKVLDKDVDNFITNIEVSKVGEKTTVVNAHTLTGFDIIGHSSCVNPENYDEEFGKEYAMEKIVNDLWGHLGFVLQWAKFGLTKGRKLNFKPPFVTRMGAERKELLDRIEKLNAFINGEQYVKLTEIEKQNLQKQLQYMSGYFDVLSKRIDFYLNK